MTDFEQPKRLTKMVIDDKSVEQVKKLSFPLLYDDENELLYKMHIRLLKVAMEKNNSNEVGFIINLMDRKHFEILGNEDGIELRKVIEARDLFFTAPSNSLIFIHNHPKNSTFSEVDLKSFLAADSLLMITVVCNNGRVYSLTKEHGFDAFKAISYYNYIYDNCNEEESAVKEFLRTCKKVELIYGYGGE